MSAKQRLAQEIAALPDSLTIEEAVERLYRAFKQKHAQGAPASQGGSLPPSRRSFQEMYEGWRQSVDPSDLSTAEDDPFADVRGGVRPGAVAVAVWSKVQ